MLIQPAFNFSSIVQRWVFCFSGFRLLVLRWFVVFLASSHCAESASRYFLVVLRCFGGAVLFQSSRPSPNSGYPFWLPALTFLSSRPAYCGLLTSAVRFRSQKIICPTAASNTLPIFPLRAGYCWG